MSTKKPDAKKSQSDAVALIKAAAAAQAKQPQQAQAQMQGTPFDFSKIHLHIGIPCYGGMMSEPTVTSLLRFILLAQQYLKKNIELIICLSVEIRK